MVGLTGSYQPKVTARVGHGDALIEKLCAGDIRGMLVEEARGLILAGLENEPWRTQAVLKSLANHARLLPTVIEDQDGADFQNKLAELVTQADQARDYYHAEDVIIAELADVGIVINRLIDLRKPGVGNSRGVPALLRGIKQNDNLPLRTNLVTVLGVPWATQDVIQPLIDEFHRTLGAQDALSVVLLETIPQTIEVIADARWLDAILSVIHEPEAGNYRYYFVQVLRKMRKRQDEVVPELLKLIATSESMLYLPAARLLARWRVVEALPRVRELLETIEQRPAYPALGAHDRSFERSELKKAIAQLERAASANAEKK